MANNSRKTGQHRAQCFILLLISLSINAKQRHELRVAVSANFVAAFSVLQPQAEAACGCSISVTAGSSGILATQFDKGAPFDLFFSADSAKPQWLHARGKTAASPITYAMGRLIVVDNHRPELAVNDIGQPVSKRDNWRLAIANSNTAPYGLAAEQVLAHIQVNPSTTLVRGNSVLQTLQFFHTGNVDQAIVAHSLLEQLVGHDFSWLPLPAELHQPIAQQVVIHPNANQNAAQSVVRFILSDKAQGKLQQLGYNPVEGEHVSS